MSHISTGPPPVDEILALLGPGDIVTHAFTGQSERLIDDEGRLLEAARQARDRGVIFDIGHGSGSFSWTSAEALIGAGFMPDMISTDLHWVSLPGPNLLEPLKQEIVAGVKGDGSPQFTLPVAMSKFLHLGMSLNDVVTATTSRPASVLGMDGEIGTLRPTARADLATFVIDEGSYELHDIHGNRRLANRMLRNTGTFKDGRAMPQKLNPPPPSWIPNDRPGGLTGFSLRPAGPPPPLGQAEGGPRRAAPSRTHRRPPRRSAVAPGSRHW